MNTLTRKTPNEMLFDHGHGVLAGLIALTTCLPALADSQAPDARARGDTRVLETITVTAQKREEQLQDVPISISVLSGEKLDSFTGGGVSNALAYLPAVVLTQPGDVQLVGNNTFISVRGVSSSAGWDGGASPTAFYIDGVPFGFVKSGFFPNLPSYDLDHVEVLKGPHGSLYGANALNGVVRALTHEADLDRFEAKTRQSLSTIKGGDLIYRGDATFNVPLITDKLAARATVGYSEGGGWINSAVKRNINDREQLNARLKIKAQPAERWSVGLTGWVSRDTSGAIDMADDHDFIGLINDDAESTIDFNVAGIQVGYELPAVAITSSTSYIEYEFLGRVNVSFFLPALTVPITNRYHSKVLAEELNLTSTREGPWRWTGGLYYRDAEDRVRNSDSGIFWPIPFDSSSTSESFAVFGELTRRFGDGQFELTGGLRYFEDHGQTVENVNFDGLGPLIESPQETYTKVSPRAVLTWHATEDSMFYLSYGEGFRSGGSQYSSISAYLPEFPAYKPDTLKNSEVGAKGSLLGGRLSYEAAYYYINWQDIQQGIQVPSPTGPGGYSAIVNGASASGTGFDLALGFEPVDRLNLGLTYTQSDLAQDETVRRTDGTVLIPKGSRLAYSPKYTLGGSASWGVLLGVSGLEARLSAQASYSPGATAISLLEGQSVTVSHGDLIRNLSAGLEVGSTDQRWTAKFFVDNLTNERNIGIRFPFQFLDREFPLSPNRQPRTMGVQFEYRFD